jgi:hypothetical protein
LSFLFLFFCLALPAIAQTGGPGQPEFMQFQQAGTEGLVNPSTGAFSYQVPLFTIGGYPMNLTYQSGIQMEDVATMVGLGWNLNAGSIVRTLRGLPDDFYGDTITKEFSVKENVTYGGKISADVEITGFSEVLSISAGEELGIFHNNYKGWGLERSLSGALSAAFKKEESIVGGSASLGMGVSANSQTGVDKYISPSIGLKLGVGKDQTMSASLGKTWAVNSNEGLKTSTNTSLSYTKYAASQRKYVKKGVKRDDGQDSGSYALSMGSRSYLNNSFQPDIDYPFVNTSGTYSGTVGLDFYYVDPSFRLTGYFTKQKLAVKVQHFEAYGLMYEDEQKLGGKVLMDFNREKKLPYYIGESKILPVPYTTPDVFNLNAQGLSLSFTVNKNDIGIVGDPKISVISSGDQLGVEANLGSLFKAGANLGTTTSEQQGGRWKPKDFPFLFQGGQQVFGDQLYQQIYLKNNGEINAFQHDLFNQLNRYRPYTALMEDKQSVSLHNISSTLNKSQPIRQSAISYLTAAEAKVAGFDKEISYYTFSGGTEEMARTHDFRATHHLSEISITQPDGMRYVFGIPVYNTQQKEVTFNASKDDMIIDAVNNLVHYSGSDNTVNNQNGIDHYFEATHTPPYATQFLITAVLSPDYRDITGDGISDDDLGNYVKFSYYREDSLYKWRTPYEQNRATYNRGLRSDPLDDKGSYVYGKKELWYIRSMESRTEIAFFDYSERSDGLGVKGEDGGKNPDNILRKLDSIRVYSKPDYSANQAAAIPMKTIVFTYDYELCKKVNNNINPGEGKLTLKKLAIAHEASKKGLHTPYTFSYGEQPNGPVVNPHYSVRDVNRWGYYQENPANAHSDCHDLLPLSNIDFPYASQDRSMMDENAYAWNLTGIEIPGGGKIAVEYEAHDYAYIQDKAPGQMFKVAGINAIGRPQFYNNNHSDHYYNIFFELTEPVSSQREFEAKYIRDIKDNYLYYKFYVNLRGGKFEYVTGYAKVQGYGLHSNGYGFLNLVPAVIDDDKPSSGNCNPILKSAIQFMRINRNELIFTPGTQPTNIEGFIKSLHSISYALDAQLAADASGINQYCIEQNFAREVYLDKSFIRLYNPNRSKIAGGARAKRVSITDQWADMAGGGHQSKSYTTSYYYTTEETVPDSISTIISSGVADYEPMIGGDEISLKYPIFYSDVKKRAPDNDFYVEEPINESLFPAPQIYYSKVTQLTNEEAPQDVARTGKVISEFYTAKDYPVIVGRTGVLEKRDKTEYNSFQMPFFAIDQQHDFATVAQGYSIVLNNMSGMPKATWVYNEQGDRISGEEMEYFPDNESIITIDQKGRIHPNTRMGLSVDYTVDGREAYSISTTNIMATNLNTSMIGVLPIPVIMPLSSEMTEEKQFRSLVINKVIHRNGILKSRTVHSQSASVTTENLAFDQVSGEALLTKTTNEFNDSLFSFNYPAWWMYEGMGPAYKNTRLIVNSDNINSVKQFLMAGDELRNPLNGYRLWVNESGSANFVDDKGTVPNSPLSGTCLAYTSGAKNLLGASAGQVVAWNSNPLDNGDTISFLANSILNSGATEYYDKAVSYCENCKAYLERWKKNDYLAGLKGNWKPKKAWFYLTDRTGGTLASTETDIRRQGLLMDYSDFWRLPAPPNASWSIDSTNWEWAEKTNLTDANGLIIETEDRIGRKVASLVIHDGTLIGSQTLNAGYSEVFSENFEDYKYAVCSSQIGELKRLKKLEGTASFSDAYAHTGKYAIKVDDHVEFETQKPYQSIVVDGDLGVSDTTDCTGGFYPESNKAYIFSCWVRVDKPQPILSNSEAVVRISHDNGVLADLKAEGPIIEGWQRIEGSFTTPAQFQGIRLRFNKGGNHPALYDDIRIFPADANMVSYVYDDLRLRHTYTLDENNYFTKYEYNNQGELIRIKKETEKGIITLQESNHGLIKQNQ